MKKEYCYDTKSNDYIVKIEVHIPISAYSKREAEDIAKDMMIKEGSIKKINVMEY